MSWHGKGKGTRIRRFVSARIEKNRALAGTPETNALFAGMKCTMYGIGVRFTTVTGVRVGVRACV